MKRRRKPLKESTKKKISRALLLGGGAAVGAGVGAMKANRSHKKAKAVAKDLKSENSWKLHWALYDKVHKEKRRSANEEEVKSFQEQVNSFNNKIDENLQKGYRKDLAKKVSVGAAVGVGTVLAGAVGVNAFKKANVKKKKRK